MHYRFLTAAAVAALALGACSNKSADTSGSSTTSTTTTTASTTPAAPPAATPDASATTTPAAAPAAGGATATPAAATEDYATYQAKADAAHGKTVFMQCMACHVAEKGQNRIGPSLYAVVGRHSGMIPDYQYSSANKNSGITWTEDELFKYLKAPQQVVPGTKMAFAGLPNPQDRADVIAYLKSVPTGADAAKS